MEEHKKAKAKAMSLLDYSKKHPKKQPAPDKSEAESPQPSRSATDRRDPRTGDAVNGDAMQVNSGAQTRSDDAESPQPSGFVTDRGHPMTRDAVNGDAAQVKHGAPPTADADNPHPSEFATEQHSLPVREAVNSGTATIGHIGSETGQADVHRSRVGNPRAMPVPPSWFAENPASGKDGPYDKRLDLQSCAVIMDDREVDTHLPLFLSNKQRVTALRTRTAVPFFKGRPNSNSQAPGLSIVHNNVKDLNGSLVDCSPGSTEANAFLSNQSACYAISPDQCAQANVTIRHASVDELGSEHKLQDRPELYDDEALDKIVADWKMKTRAVDASNQPLTGLSVMEIDITFKPEQHPICRLRGKPSAFEQEAEELITALAQASHIKILVAYQHRWGPLAWYRSLIEYCMQPNYTGMSSFWGYAEQYHHYSKDATFCLVDIMIDRYIRHAHFPDFPAHLSTKDASVPGGRVIRDAADMSDKPIITTREQWALKTVIALLRELQSLGGYTYGTGHSTMPRQMKAIRMVMDEPAHDGTFDMGRLVLGLSPPVRGPDLEAEFREASTWRNGDLIEQHQRDRVDQVLREIMGAADKQQQRLMRMSLEGLINCYLELQSAPGSGKTTNMIAVAMHYALHNQRTVIAAQQHTVVDHMVGLYTAQTTDLETTDLAVHLQFVRLYHTSGEQSLRLWCGETPVPQASADIRYPQYSLAYSTMKAAMNADLNASQALRDYRDALVVFRQSSKNTRDCKVLTKAAEPAEEEYLATCRVVFVTADTLSSLPDKKRISADALCMEEVSQLTIPHFNQAVQRLSGLRRVLAVGDALQLGPKLQSSVRKTSEYAHDLSRSPIQGFFLHQEQRCKLSENHRNPKAIVSLLPKLGCKSDMPSSRQSVPANTANDTIAKIEAQKSDSGVFGGILSSVDLRKCPLVFLDVPDDESGMDYLASTFATGRDATFQQSKAQPLLDGRHHATGIIVGSWLVKDLIERVGIPPEEILHISNYRKDAQMIEDRYRMMDAEKPDSEPYAKLNVGTVDGLKGSEADIVVHALASAEKDALTWVGDAARTIVALTRTKKAYFMVGEWGKLKRERAQGGPDMKKRTENLFKFLDFVDKNDTIIKLIWMTGPDGPYLALDSAPRRDFAHRQDLGKRKYVDLDAVAAPQSKRRAVEDRTVGDRQPHSSSTARRSDWDPSQESSTALPYDDY